MGVRWCPWPDTKDTFRPAGGSPGRGHDRSGNYSGSSELDRRPTQPDQSGTCVHRNRREQDDTIEQFKQRMDRIDSRNQISTQSEGSARIYLPGEMEWERREIALEQGMTLPEHVIGSLAGVAEDWRLENELKTLLG